MNYDGHHLGHTACCSPLGQDGVSMLVRLLRVSEDTAVSIVIGTVLVADLVALWTLLAK